MDFDGSIKEMPNLNNKDYAINFLTPTTNYTVLRIEFDSNTNEKRFVPLINESKLNPNMNSKFLLILSLTNLVRLKTYFLFNRNN